jgi:hypothetical protein
MILDIDSLFSDLKSAFFAFEFGGIYWILRVEL